MINLKKGFIESDARDKCEGREEVIHKERVIYDKACFEA